MGTTCLFVSRVTPQWLKKGFTPGRLRKKAGVVDVSLPLLDSSTHQITRTTMIMMMIADMYVILSFTPGFTFKRLFASKTFERRNDG